MNVFRLFQRSQKRSETVMRAAKKVSTPIPESCSACDYRDCEGCAMRHIQLAMESLSRGVSTARGARASARRLTDSLGELRPVALASGKK